MGGIELRDVRFLETAERIEVRVPRAERAMGRDELQNGELLRADLRLITRFLERWSRLPRFRKVNKTLADFFVRHIGRTVVEPLELVEITPPPRLDRLRILEIGLVQRFDERCVRAE